MKTGRNIEWMIRLVLFLFFLLAPGVVQADLGDILLKFQPYLRVQEEYSNNIDLVPENKKDDFITTVFAGVRYSTLPRSTVTGEFRQAAQTREDNIGVDLDYRLGYSTYAKATNNNYLRVDGTLNGWYTWANRFALRVSHSLIRSDDSREEAIADTTTIPEFISGTFVDLRSLYLPGIQRRRSLYLQNIFVPTLEYKFGRDSLVGLTYRSNIYDSQRGTAQNSREDFINPRLVYQFTVRHGILLEYGYTLGQFETLPDLKGHMGRGRYTYRFNPKTAIFGEHLFLRRDFDQDEPGYSVHAPSLGIEHRFSRRLSGNARVGYFWQSPEKGSGVEGPSYDVTLTHRGEKIIYTLRGQGGYREDFFTAENLGFTKSYRTTGAVTYRLMEKMTTGVSGSYEWAQSKFTPTGASTPSNRTENIWSVNGNLNYELLKWLTLSLNVSYREDRSNLSYLDYSEFRTLFRIEVKYL